MRIIIRGDYGSYQLARCIIEGIRAAKIDLAKHVMKDVPPFNPAKPDPPEDFAVPPSV